MMLRGRICDQLPAARQTRTFTHTHTHTCTLIHRYDDGVRATKARAGTRGTEDVYYSVYVYVFVCLCVFMSVCTCMCKNVYFTHLL